ncbi:MAG: hypothetical protein Q9170_000759 [Blastenia crenularia]
MYLCLIPGNPSQWSGVLFVRKGPYSPAVLRFAISFPPRYPEVPPSITFITDIFHPLVTPLTTYTYTIGSPSSDPVSSIDEERLPPGGFGLRDAFPHWFAGSEHAAPSSVSSSINVNTSVNNDDDLKNEETTSPKPETWPSPGRQEPGALIIKVLGYVKSAFDEDRVLDELPLHCAADSGAWKAWQAHRRETLEYDESRTTFSDRLRSTKAPSAIEKPQLRARHPDEWSWEGVWKERVRRGIEASTSEPALFGAGGGDEIVGLLLYKCN